MNIRALGLSSFAALLAITPALKAQGTFSVPGYDAVVATPIGALSTYLPRVVFSTDVTPAVIHLRFGMRDEDSIRVNSFVMTAEMPYRRTRIAVTAGIQSRPGISLVMAGAEWQGIISRGLLTRSETGPQLVLMLKGELGFATVVDGPNPETLFTSAFSIPLTVPVGSDVIIAPFAAPGLAFGVRSRGGVTEYEPQVLVSGGIVLHNPSRIDLTLGVSRVLLQGARSIYGVGITWNR